jgi:hypothetical protein
MPMMPVYITLSSTGTSRAVNLDYNSRSPFNVSVGVTYGSSTMTATYGVEYTLQDPLYQSLIGSTAAQIWIADANLPAGQTATGTTNYMFPVAAVRCTVSAISSGSVTFCVMEG